MKLVITALASVILVSGCATTSQKVDPIWAALSSDKAIFHRFIDEIDIRFAVVNDSKSPILFRHVHTDVALLVNGRELKESSFIFGNGPIPTDTHLLPGSSFQFGVRLTRYFANPGDYQLVWRGTDFETAPIVFRVVDETPDIITKTEASHIAYKYSQENAKLPDNAPAAIRETPDSFLVIYPRLHEHAPGGDDFIVKVRVDKATGQVLEFVKGK